MRVEYRRLQESKGGSYLISIPKRWVERMGLKGGTTVVLMEAEDGSLILKAGREEEAEKGSVAVIELDENVEREVLGKYLMGASIVHIKSPKRITLDERERVKRTLTVLIGTEIIEETPNELVIQCMLSPIAIPVKTLLNRAHRLALQMHVDAIASLKERDEELAQSVIKRDEDLNRLYFLIVRQLRSILQTARLSEKAQVSLVECLDYRLVARALEFNGDQAVAIAKSSIALKSYEVPAEILNKLIDLSEIVRRMQEGSLIALFKHDTKHAEGYIKHELAPKTNSMIEQLNQLILQQPSTPAYYLNEIVNSLRRMKESSIDVADLVVKL